MSEYTPSTEEVRDDFSYGHVMASGRALTYVASEAFDRWLLAERARIWREGFDACADYMEGPDWARAPGNPYRTGGHS